MPELPEVEEVRRSLEPFLLNYIIKAVRVYREDFVTPNAKALENITGKKIVRTLRHGKKLLFIAEDGQVVLLHLGMSGRVDHLPTGSPLEKHTHVLFSLKNKQDIRFVDPRRFGGIWYYPTLEAAQKKEIEPLGKDALDLTPADLAHWKTTRGFLKQRLLSQFDVAGLGNIYVDEALWLAQLHPLQRVNRIPPQKITALVAAIHKVLRHSLSMGGTTLRDYRNVSNKAGDFQRKLKAYGRAGQPCLRCSQKLKSAQIAGRTTVYCPTCQRAR
jgi:DNA-formamidopyrimidine glycosylase